MEPDVSLLALDSGPCGGKTSILSVARQKAEDYGFVVQIVEEAATAMIKNGMQLKDAVHAKRWDDVREYQKVIMMRQLGDEESARLAVKTACRRTGKPGLVICDRGLPSNLAYFGEDSAGFQMYQEILREVTGLDHQRALERYKGVVIPVTAADGAEDFYTCENNVARDETPEVARYLDKRTKMAWNGHPHVAPIDNSTDFEKKKLRALQAVCRILGVPEPLEIERKYLVEYPCFPHFPVHRVTVPIDQTYLVSLNPEEEIRVRRRTMGDSSTYYLTKKREARTGRVETERMIGWREYFDFLAERDKNLGTIKKDRITFLHNNQYFELDIFKNLDKALCLLEVEIPDLAYPVELPPFLKVLKDVTDDPEYKNRNLAKRVREVV